MTEGTVRHVGLAESVHMIAQRLGWKLERVDETLEPAIAPRDLDTEYLRIPAGAAAGIKQVARGYRNGELVDQPRPPDVRGRRVPARPRADRRHRRRIDMTIAGGVAGDLATAAIVVNSIPKLLAARPGLLTMSDLPLVHRLNPLELRELAGAKKPR